MPTGYTFKIHDGEDVDAKEFIMDCSRAFGALVMMRDAPTGTPIPERFEPSMYAKEKADECKAELIRVQSLSEEEAVAEMDKWYQEKCDQEFKYYQDSVSVAERYKRTIKQVEQWLPPTVDHVGLKDFCLKQLNQSLDSDCRRAFKPHVVPEKPILDTWITERNEALKSEITYYEKCHAEEIERTEKRNEWLKQLRDSLSGF